MIKLMIYVSLQNSLILMQANQAESYQLLCEAGDGGQGKAYLAQKEGSKYVVKLYNPLKQSPQHFRREIQIMYKLDNPHIIKIVEHFPQGRVVLGNVKQIRPVLVLQFAERGELLQLVNTGKLSEQISRTLFKQLLQALKAMKQAEIAHLDLKLQNIFLSNNYQLKVGDFGLAKDIGKEHEPLQTWQGSEMYIAPEIHNHLYRGYPADIFAAGVILFLMVFRTPPFDHTLQNNSDYNMIRNGKYDEYWQKFDKNRVVSMPLKRLLIRMLSPDPEVRPNLHELENEQWLLGPTSNQEQLQKYLSPRYDFLYKKDKIYRKIRKTLKQKIQAKQEEMKKEKEERSRSRDKQIRYTHKFQPFLEEIIALNISSSVLPQKQYLIPYASIAPELILLWIEEFLSMAKKEKIALIGAIDKAEIETFDIQLKENGLIEVAIQFCLTSESICETVLIKLQGKIFASKEKVGVLWCPKKGNDFWCKQLKMQLQEEFEITFCQA